MVWGKVEEAEDEDEKGRQKGGWGQVMGVMWGCGALERPRE